MKHEFSLHGAALHSLDDELCRQWLDWLIQSGPCPSQTHRFEYALAHCDSGVTWGYWDAGRDRWRLSCEVDSDLSPGPEQGTIQELRIFGPTAEVLIWTGDEGLRGRVLADDEADAPADRSLRPLDEGRRLRGEPHPGAVEAGFIRYADPGGSQHLAPESFPRSFSVRHYFEQDMETGAVRIAASRLRVEEGSP